MPAGTSACSTTVTTVQARTIQLRSHTPQTKLAMDILQTLERCLQASRFRPAMRRTLTNFCRVLDTRT